MRQLDMTKLAALPTANDMLAKNMGQKAQKAEHVLMQSQEHGMIAGFLNHSDVASFKLSGRQYYE